MHQDGDTLKKMERTHILLFPFPVQGRVTPMLNLAQLLCHAGLHVTFLSSENTHHRLPQRQALSARFPTLHFRSLPDGLPPDDPRTGNPLIHISMIPSLRSVTKMLLRDLVISLTKSKNYDDESCDSTTISRPPPLSCMITDDLMSFAIDVAEELGIPVMALQAISAGGTWSFSYIPDLIQQGQLPFGDEDMEKMVSEIPEMGDLLRYKDLPNFCRLPKDDPTFRFMVEEIQALGRVSALLLNTFDDLDASILPHIALRFSKTYTIGPIHALLKSRTENNLSPSAASLRKEDRSCMAWLDSQKLRSVIFVSFGSLSKMTRGQLLEFWYGLVNSGQPFLWVVRPDIVEDEEKVDVIPMELEVGPKEKGFIVEWAPQEEVLSHDAVGAFLTHSGWNSTMEGIWAGVPMLCWPRIADQPVTSRWVGEVWKIGVDMKDKCDRITVEMMIRTLMVEGDQRDEILESAKQFAKLARRAVNEGGSSYNNLEKLIQELTNM